MRKILYAMSRCLSIGINPPVRNAFQFSFIVFLCPAKVKPQRPLFFCRSRSQVYPSAANTNIPSVF